MNILDILKFKIKHLSSMPSDDDLLIYLDEVEVVITNFCNVPEVPPGLIYTWANMAADLVGNNKAQSDDGESGEVSTVKVGDTTVTMKGISETTKENLDTILFKYQDKLVRFRKLVW